MKFEHLDIFYPYFSPGLDPSSVEADSDQPGPSNSSNNPSSYVGRGGRGKRYKNRINAPFNSCRRKSLKCILNLKSSVIPLCYYASRSFGYHKRVSVQFSCYFNFNDSLFLLALYLSKHFYC